MASQRVPMWESELQKVRDQKGTKNHVIQVLILQKRSLQFLAPPLANEPGLPELPSPDPALQVNTREFAPFRLKLHPHSFLPATCPTSVPITKAPFVLPAAQSTAPTQPTALQTKSEFIMAPVFVIEEIQAYKLGMYACYF